ncbi:MAG: hypothetical protein DMG02_02135 [Acidobacteria bacterium]|nr:MAG: hypothetical protein DMG02_02135 [Acidobacteriota bacterium]PYR05316.1 MAG: hypothetical protein DMF99_28755 [Acidobacteriota bacterium]
MLPHGGFERRQITIAHRRQDGPVLLLRALHSVHEDAAEEVAPHAIPAREHPFGHLAKHRQARQRADGEMEPRVEGGPLGVAFRRNLAIHVGDERRQ